MLPMQARILQKKRPVPEEQGVSCEYEWKQYFRIEQRPIQSLSVPSIRVPGSSDD
jgi:hypothetical protein